MAWKEFGIASTNPKHAAVLFHSNQDPTTKKTVFFIWKDIGVCPLIGHSKHTKSEVLIKQIRTSNSEITRLECAFNFIGIPIT